MMYTKEQRDAQLVAEGWTRRPDGYWEPPRQVGKPRPIHGTTELASPKKRIRKPLLNQTETYCLMQLEANGHRNIMKQAITLRLDPPFKRYTPDLAYMQGTYLTLIEVKGPHRFREKGIAKAALAAKTYPMFRFELWDWNKDRKRFNVSVLSS